MKFKKILVFTLLVFCFFSVKDVYAETGCNEISRDEAILNITSARIHDKNKTTYSPGEKVYVDLKAVTGSNVSIAVDLRDDKSETGRPVYLKNIIGNPGEVISAYFIVPDDIAIDKEYEIYGYEYLLPGEVRPSCAFYRTIKEEAESFGTNYIEDSYAKFKVVEKKEEVKDILKSVTVEKNYTYFGGKLTFNVETTEPVESVLLVFANRTNLVDGKPTYFSINLISGGKNNNFTSTVNAPTYGINNVYEGDYFLEDIIIYSVDNGKYTYNANKEEAEKYNQRYINNDLKIFIGKPIEDIIKESNFEIKNAKLIKNDVKIGDKVSVFFEWNYNSMNIRMQSVMLSFYDEKNKNMFSTYLKDISQDTSIIIPSNAKAGEYLLKNISIIFDSYVGETNTILLDQNTISSKYKSIFEQKLTINENIDAKIYYLAEQLQENEFEKIRNAKDNAVVTVNANETHVVPAELFDAIKETSKQVVIEYDKNEWVFNGTDIELSKPVDVSIKFYDTKDLNVNADLKTALGNDLLVIEFPENGKLPGKALIRIKDEDIYNRLKGNKYFIYHVDEENNKLNKVAVELQKSYNGYIEFYIDHNSKYVITSEEITDNVVLGDDDEVMKVNSQKTTEKTNNNKSDGDNTILYIAILEGVVVLVGIVLIIIFSKNKSKKIKKLEDKIDLLINQNDIEDK